MRFIDFATYCRQLEEMSGRLEMIDLISRVLPGLDDDDLPVFVRFVMGRIFPDWSPLKIGIGPNLLFDAVTGIVDGTRDDIIHDINMTGDVGTAFENILSSKKSSAYSRRSTQAATVQTPLTEFISQPPDENFALSGGMTLTEVERNLHRIATAQGKASQEVKLDIIRLLLSRSKPLEGRYIARLLLEDLRIGVGEGNMKSAIARAFNVDAALVEHANQAINDLGEVAILAKKGEPALREVRIRPFHPVKMMLAQQGTISGTIEENGSVAAEFKYDGSRFQFHKSGGTCRMYSRKLEEVTGSLPDILEMLDSAVDHDVILDGEVIAIKDGRPMPFQAVLRRFRRKYQVDSMKEEIRMEPHVFDILYLDGETLIDLPLSERRARLDEVMTAYRAPQTVSDDLSVIEAIYNDALSAGHEGIMLKVISSSYTPGIRGKNWIKIKPAVDTLDLVVMGAEWGEGKRAHVFGSFLLACQNEEGELILLSKVATGFSDDQLAEIYALLKDRVISHSGKEVKFEPLLVIEAGYSEIQKSPNYEGGYALRFPRFVRIRDDKGVGDIETIDGIRERYRRQSA